MNSPRKNIIDSEKYKCNPQKMIFSPIFQVYELKKEI